MPGVPKRGLDFAGWNVDIFENDTKIDMLIDSQGWLGFCVYFYLCQRAYASDGYFYRWSYANASTTARRMGGGIGSKTVIETVKMCLQVGLYDAGLFARCGILTSRGIQRRYCEAVKRRTYRTVIRDYWLLDDEESSGLVFCTLESHSPHKDAHPPHKDAPKSTVKESKVQYSKGEGEPAARPPLSHPQFRPPGIDEVTEYAAELGGKVNPRRFMDYYEANGWMMGRTPMKDWKAAMRRWNEAEEKAGGKANRQPSGQPCQQRQYSRQQLDSLAFDWKTIAETDGKS